MKITLLRHAESKKNYRGTIGGVGESLTLRGKNAAHRMSCRVGGKCIESRSVVLVAPCIQTVETANIVFSGLENICILDVLRPISLGRLSGISAAVAKELFPKDMESLEKWNRGEIDIAQVCIEGIEDVIEYFLRGLSLIFACEQAGIYDLKIVATRSSLVLYHNIFFRRVPEAGGNYVNQHFKYCDPVGYKLSRGDLSWIRKQLASRMQR